MNGLRWISIILISFGILFIFYGWTQTWDYSYDGTNDYMYTVRVVRTYVGMVGGFILIIVGGLLNTVRKYIESLELKIYQLKTEIKKK